VLFRRRGFIETGIKQSVTNRLGREERKTWGKKYRWNIHAWKSKSKRCNVILSWALPLFDIYDLFLKL